MSTSPMVRHHANDFAYLRGVQDGADSVTTGLVRVLSNAARVTGGGFDYTLIEEVAESYRKGRELGNRLGEDGDSPEQAVEVAIANERVNADESWRVPAEYWEQIKADALVVPM